MTSYLRPIPLTDVSLRDACQTLNMAYQGYIVPVSFDPLSLVRRIQAEDIDLFSSRLLLVDQQPAGIMLIARRGRVSRIAALGIVSHLRGEGFGRQAVALAIEEARSRGDDRQVLEVIETNLAAISTYTKAGFVPRRRLVGYAHDPVQSGDGVVSCPAQEILHLLTSAYPDSASWQTSPLCFASAIEPVAGFRTDDGTAAALVDGTGEAARLLAFGVAPSRQRQGVGRRFMRDLLGRFPNKSWTIPAYLPESQASAFLVSTGWKRSVLTQLEMELPLASSDPTQAVRPPPAGRT